jgi:hypothetical protein
MKQKPKRKSIQYGKGVEEIEAVSLESECYELS